MTISQIGFLSAVVPGGRINQAALGYFRGRLQNRIHQFVLQQFIDKQKAGLTQADIARSLDRRPEQINRWLGSPSNWTLDTVCDLVLAISHAELTFSLSQLVSDTQTGGNVTPQCTDNNIAVVDYQNASGLPSSSGYPYDIFRGQVSGLLPTSTQTNPSIISAKVDTQAEAA